MATDDGATSHSPKRIVSLVPAVTETLFDLGIGDRVAGVSTYCDYPDEARSLPKVGTFTDPVAEAIVALSPDLVLTSPSPGNQSAVRALERSGVRVVVVAGDGTLEEAVEAVVAVADAAGVPARGRELAVSIRRRLDAVRTKAAPLERPAVAVAIGREPLVLAGPASYLGELVVAAGGRNVADAVGGRWPRVGLEFLVTARPDVIVDLAAAMAAGEKPAEATVAGSGAVDAAAAGKPAAAAMPASGQGAAAAAWSRLAGVPAVDRGRILVDGTSVLLRPGPRVADAAEALLAMLHPEAAAGGGGAP